MTLRPLLLALCALAPASAIPLTAQATPAPAVTPAARPADVATEDAIMAALYDVISGPAGQGLEPASPVVTRTDAIAITPVRARPGSSAVTRSAPHGGSTGCGPSR